MRPAISNHQPSIELRHYERLHEVERRIWYSPIAIGLALVGLVAAGYTFWALSRGFIVVYGQVFAGYAVVLAAYGAMLFYYFGYRFQRVKCPGCGEIMRPFVTDLDESPKLKLLTTIEIGGRHYRQPYDEDDRRPWIRLMAKVRACLECKKYVNCSRLHFETCTEEELGKIRQRVGAA